MKVGVCYGFIIKLILIGFFLCEVNYNLYNVINKCLILGNRVIFLVIMLEDKGWKVKGLFYFFIFIFYL